MADIKDNAFTRLMIGWNTSAWNLQEFFFRCS